jgi:Bacterial SH3 domain
MINSLRVVSVLVMLGALSTARADTVYVAERIRLGMHAEAADASPVVKTVESGAALEELERLDNYVHVRDPQGVEGWIEARYLTPEAPARLQLTKLQGDLAKTRAQATDAQAQLKKAQAAMAEQAQKIKTLEKEIADKPAPPASAIPAPPPAAPPVGKIPKEGGFIFSFLWLGISFAMLGAGFAAGVFWLRESIRKRSGGMYLRV